MEAGATRTLLDSALRNFWAVWEMRDRPLHSFTPSRMNSGFTAYSCCLETPVGDRWTGAREGAYQQAWASEVEQVPGR